MIPALDAEMRPAPLSFLRNIGFLLAAEVASKVVALLYVMLLARRFGPNGLGAWTYALTLASLHFTVFNFGLAILFTREAAAHPSQAKALLARFLPVRLALTALGLALLIPVAWLTRNLVPPALPILFGVALAVGSVAEMFRAVFRARQRLQYEAVLSFGEHALAGLLAVVAITLGASLAGTTAAWVGGAVASAAAAIILARAAGAVEPMRRSLAQTRSILREAAPLFVLAVFAPICFRQDVLFLRAMLPIGDVGLYGAAYRLFDMFAFIPGSFALAYLPAAAAARRGSVADMRALCNRSLGLSFALSLPLAIVLYMRAPDIVRILFGQDFAGSVAAVRVLVWTLPFFFANPILGNTLIAGGLQRVPARAIVVSTVVNAGLNLLLIPRLGIVGAAWATLITEALQFALQGAVLGRRLVRLDPVAALAKPALAAAAAGSALWICRGLSLAPALVAGVVAYLVVAATTGLWRPGQWLVPIRAPRVPDSAGGNQP